MSHSSGMERELKFADVDHHALRERLAGLEAESQGPRRLEDNWLFDRDGELVDSGSLLRLRVDRSGSWLTHKGPATYEGPVKVREETETLVDNVDAMRSILESLGYHEIYRYQKYREEWLLGSIIISLDHTPIGDYVEFEGEGCEAVARRFQLDPDHAERRNYLRLYSDYRREHPDAPEDMIFKT